MSGGLQVTDSGLRHAVYRMFVDTGTAPSRGQVAAWGADDGALERLHDAHALVLDETGEIRMALPFSAVPTDHRVVSGDRSWWANCAWDSLGIPALLGIDAEIDARWMDTGEAVELAVIDGELRGPRGFVHFAMPARHWWADIVDT